MMSFSAEGQESRNSKRGNHSFGLNAGFISGLGFSYRYMPGRLGVDITAIPFYSQDAELYTSQGITLNFIVSRNSRLDHFIFVGNSLFYTFSKEEGLIYRPVSDEWVLKKWEYEDFFYVFGGGWGIRLKGKRNLDWTFRLGAMWNDDFEYGILPSAGIALHYRSKK
jgi:hypothetical protein